MKSLNDISTKLRSTASLVGGDHLKNEEIEQLLKALADDIDEINDGIITDILDTTNKVKEYTGLDEIYVLATKREKNIKYKTS